MTLIRNWHQLWILSLRMEESITNKLSKYNRPKNCSSLTKVKVNQVIWDNLESEARSTDLKMQKVQQSMIKGSVVLAEIANTLIKVSRTHVPN